MKEEKDKLCPFCGTAAFGWEDHPEHCYLRMIQDAEYGIREASPAEFIEAWNHRPEPPKHETVEQWEKRTGQTYPDDGPCWMSTMYPRYIGGGLYYQLVTKKRAYDLSKFSTKWTDEQIKKFYEKNPVYIANENGKPEE